MAPTKTSAVVIGAGPYGLSVAAHLRARGVAMRVFGDPMSTWRTRMPVGMKLKSAWYASDLSAAQPGHRLADYCREAGLPGLTEQRPVPVEDFIAYGLWFRERQGLEIESSRISGLVRADGGIRLALDSGEEIQADSVVAATGLMGYAYVPPELSVLAPQGPSPDGPLSHSSQFQDLSTIAHRDVTVIGAGQSALENAALLREAGGTVRLVARRQPSFGGRPKIVNGRERTALRPSSPMGPGWTLAAVHHFPSGFRRLPARTRLNVVANTLGPYGSWWLRDRVLNQLPIHGGQRIGTVRRDGDRVLLELVSTTGDRTTIETEHIMSATGYRVDLRRLGFLDEQALAAIALTGGSPALDSTFQSSLPGVYFVGLAAAASFGPGQRFVCGTEFAARRASGAIAARGRTRARPAVGATG